MYVTLTGNGGSIEFVEKTHEIPIAIMGALPVDGGAALSPELAEEEVTHGPEQMEIDF
jgi:hypothetical protein